ncbi:hypothetical protein PFISCL1PPCAC_16882, partial [Pristionchus fissidentatus]
FNAFTYETDALRVHRYWKIGVGKIIPYSTLPPNDAFVVYENSGGALSEEIFWNPLGQPRTRGHAQKEEINEEFDEEEEEEFDEEAISMVRTPSVISRANLRNVRRRKSSFLLCIDAQLKVARKNIFMRRISRSILFWEITERRKSHRFPPAVKEFLREIYDEGERTGVKTDARGADRQNAGVYTGSKATKIEARAKALREKTKKKKVGEEEVEEMDVDEKEVDEVNDLFQTEGDEELVSKRSRSSTRRNTSEWR